LTFGGPARMPGIVSNTLVEVRIDQRLDAANSPEVERRLSAAIAEGARHLRLDLAEVAFISSAGLRVLAASYKQLQELGGTLQIVAVHPNAERVIELAGFGSLLLTPETGAQEPSEHYETEHARVDWFDLPGKGYQVERLGDAVLRLTARQEGCPIAFGTGILSSGGEETGDDARGAFLALDKTVFHQSADEPAPDYLQVSGLLEPEVSGAFGFSLQGSAQAQMRIATRDGAPISLGELLEVALSRHHGSAAVIGTLRVTGVEIPALRLTARDGSAQPHLIPAEILGAQHGLQLVICGVATQREAGEEALQDLPAWHWDDWTFHGIGLLAHDAPMPDGVFNPADMVERVAQTPLLALAHLAGQAGEGLGLRLERGVLWSGAF